MAKKSKAKSIPEIEIEDERVTSLELFFDLVFVFTLTQLTALLSKSLSWERLFQSFLIFIVLFWMYGGYAFIPMLFGIILLATGIKSSMEHLTTRLDMAHAFTFGVGVGLCLMGTAIFRRDSGTPQVVYRYGAALLAMLTGFLGAYVSTALQFSCLILIVIGLVFSESLQVLVKRPQF